MYKENLKEVIDEYTTSYNTIRRSHCPATVSMRFLTEKSNRCSSKLQFWFTGESPMLLMTPYIGMKVGLFLSSPHLEINIETHTLINEYRSFNQLLITQSVVHFQSVDWKFLIVISHKFSTVYETVRVRMWLLCIWNRKKTGRCISFQNFNGFTGDVPF